MNSSLPKIIVTPPGPKAREIIKRDDKALSPCNWRYIPLVLKRADGVSVEDVDGNIYLDFVAGAAVQNTGNCNPKIVDAVVEQAQEFLSYLAVPGYFYHKVVVELAERIAEITPGSFEKKVFFGLSGADACETAMKAARRYTKRQRFISFIGSNHGLTGLGAISLQGFTSHIVKDFSPLIPGVTHIPYPYCYRCSFGHNYPDCKLRCLQYLEDYVFKSIAPPEEVAAIFVEPIQGDGGVVIPPEEFHKTLREICDRYSILLVVDEIQTGFGRTGRMFASEYWNLEPDIVLLGKPMASGLPVSACVGRSEVMNLEKGSHAITGGGYFLGCIAALTTIDLIVREKLAENAGEVGAYMLERFCKMMDGHRLIGDVRGSGLLVGVEIVKDRESREPGVEEIACINYRAFEKGLITAYDGLKGNVFRIMPPLILKKDQAEVGIAILEDAITDFERGRVAKVKPIW